MIDFEKNIFIDEGFTPQFLFQFLHSTSGTKRYHVSVTIADNQVLFFEIEQRPHSIWRIIDAPKVPEWIKKIEEQIISAVVETSIT